jgi:hypothetical protein
MTKRFAMTRSRQSENHLANLPLLLIDRTACENAVLSPLGCLSFLCLHNRREDVAARTWHDTAAGCWTSWPSRCGPQQRGIRAARIHTSPYHWLVVGSLRLQGYSKGRPDCEFGHGEVRDRSPQVVYVHSDIASQPERPTIYPYSPQPQPQTINVNVKCLSY